jgi:hypothetical protein
LERIISASQILVPSENVLGLENPENYSCRVWRYQVGHSVMLVELHSDDAAEFSPLYAIFEPVRYYQGSMGWQGANFCTTPLKETASLLASLQGVKGDTDFELSANVGIKLFVVNSGNVQIRIVANWITLTDDPKNFYT